MTAYDDFDRAARAVLTARRDLKNPRQRVAKQAAGWYVHHLNTAPPPGGDGDDVPPQRERGKGGPERE